MQALVDVGRELAAIDLLRAYVARNPADYALRRSLAERLLARGDAEGAVAPLRECADAPDSQVRSWALFQLADRHQRRGEDARALALYQEVLAIDYNFPRVRLRAKELAEKMGVGSARPSAQPTMTQAAPERVAVGRWRIQQELGRGGAGAVYLAHDPHLDRDIAVKVLHPHLAARTRSRRRFFQEARAAAAIAHPGVITIFDLDESVTAIAMEYHPGGSLAERLRRGPLPPRQAVRMARQVAAAIAAIHTEGIVHRDLKPGNVLLDHERAPVLTDFGVAGLLDREGSESAAPDEGAVGTLAYMAPEQRAGAPPAAANDQYALGALLFEMLAGRPPFAAAILKRGVPPELPDLEPALAPLEPGLRPHLRAALRTLLAPDPVHRYASVGEAAGVIARLERWVGLGEERRARYGDALRVVRLAGDNEQRRALLAKLAEDLGILTAEATEIQDALESAESAANSGGQQAEA